MERPKCKTCPYWDTEFDEEIAAGEIDDDFVPGTDWPARECHRYAPTYSDKDKYIGARREEQIDKFIRDGTAQQGIWFRTSEHDWCGEHPDFPAFILSQKAALSAMNSALDKDDTDQTL